MLERLLAEARRQNSALKQTISGLRAQTISDTPPASNTSKSLKRASVPPLILKQSNGSNQINTSRRKSANVQEDAAAVSPSYFDELKKLVDQIKHARYVPGKEAPTQNESIPAGPVPFARQLGRHVLMAKIEQQSTEIDQLQALVQQLQAEKQELAKQLRHSLLQRLHWPEPETGPRLSRDPGHSVPFQDPQQSESDYLLRARQKQTEQKLAQLADRAWELNVQKGSELASVKRENEHLLLEIARLKAQSQDITKRVTTLVVLHKHKVHLLERKLEASLNVARYYLTHESVPIADTDDTETLLYGPTDSTTMLLLAGPEARASKQTPLAPKRRLRAYFLAVLFSVKAQRAAASERLWRQKVFY